MSGGERELPGGESPRGTMSGGERSPRYQLNLNISRRNVFVTQLEEGRDDEDGDVTQIPVIKEAASRILETSRNTLQKTLVLKKEVEYDRVSQELLNKKQEFEERMQALDVKKEEFFQKQLECSEKASKFEKFLKESDAKRRRAIAKYQTESRQNEFRQTEIEELKKQLETQRARQLKLHERLKKNRTYEDFLLKMADNVPEDYLDYGVDSPVKAIIRRHETLSLTNESLVDNLTALADEQENKQHALELLQRNYDTCKLTMNSELSRLQQEYDRIVERNKQLELNFNLNKGHFRTQSVEVGSLLMAVTNLAEQCHMKHYGPVDEVELLRKLEMIKEYVLEKMHVEKLASQPPEAGPLVPNPDSQASKLKKTTAKEPPKSRTSQLQRNDANKRRLSTLGANI
ncbi:coiled-coil domain-containing protein 42 homolog [Spea bombifrons]|uniref:coiled-coil domain-containing protein 42 homolog n=1 Tax=Spea bombifrons TaxID=233779 RepID=UPI00234B60AD|nr:coiled-coil domain-containing protein 42 homolog [Spea bombifrons]